jgi:hypothetical protein
MVFPMQPKFARGVGAPYQQYKMTAIEADGRFEVRGIAAGDYCVVAVSPSLGPNWRDPDTLAALGRVATRITLAEHQNLSMNLQTQAVKR